jgi:hypothetical protein
MDDGFKKPDEVIANEEDKEQLDLERAVTMQQVPNEKNNDEELVAVDTRASERLPFSKARCVILVATVAAAPFLSVRKPIPVIW